MELSQGGYTQAKAYLQHIHTYNKTFSVQVQNNGNLFKAFLPLLEFCFQRSNRSLQLTIVEQQNSTISKKRKNKIET